MIKPAKLKVKLISYTKDPEQVVVAAIRQCYSAVGADDLKRKTDKETRERLIKQVISLGHTSTLEHASFTFAIEGISRACSHQLVRHRLASYSQQSQRYVDLSKKGVKYIIPPSIKNNIELKKRYLNLLKEIEKQYANFLGNEIPAEDARFVLPNACETKIVVTMNVRALLHFFELRCCRRAQWEIRELANLMLALVQKKAPLLFNNAGPTCESQKICWEGDKMTCGWYKSIPDAIVKNR